MHTNGDIYKRIFDKDTAQCGCKWSKEYEGDRLTECPIHRQATYVAVRKFEQERYNK